MDTIVKRKNTRAKTTQKSTPIQVLTNKDYVKIMARIDELIEIPDSKLTKKQASELHTLAVAAQGYEKSIYTKKPPVLSDKYRNVFSKKDAESFIQHVQTLRKEWDNTCTY